MNKLCILALEYGLNLFIEFDTINCKTPVGSTQSRNTDIENLKLKLKVLTIYTS